MKRRRVSWVSNRLEEDVRTSKGEAPLGGSQDVKVREIQLSRRGGWDPLREIETSGSTSLMSEASTVARGDV